jgi:hypothetical protein
MPSSCSGLVFPGTLGGQGGLALKRGKGRQRTFFVLVMVGFLSPPPVTCIWGRGLFESFFFFFFFFFLSC